MRAFKISQDFQTSLPYKLFPSPLELETRSCLIYYAEKRKYSSEGEKNFSAYGAFGCEQQAEGSWLRACVCVGTEARSLLQASLAGQGTAGEQMDSQSL